MDFIDEQHVARFERGQDRRQIAGLRDDRPRRRAEANAQLARDDLGERRFAQTWRAMQQDVIQRLFPPPGRGDEDGKVGFKRRLADEVIQRDRA